MDGILPCSSYIFHIYFHIFSIFFIGGWMVFYHVFHSPDLSPTFTYYVHATCPNLCSKMSKRHKMCFYILCTWDSSLAEKVKNYSRKHAEETYRNCTVDLDVCEWSWVRTSVKLSSSFKVNQSLGRRGETFLSSLKNWAKNSSDMLREINLKSVILHRTFRPVAKFVIVQAKVEEENSEAGWQ